MNKYGLEKIGETIKTTTSTDLHLQEIDESNNGNIERIRPSWKGINACASGFEYREQIERDSEVRCG